MIVAIIGVLIALFGVMGGLVYWQIQRTNPNNIDKSNGVELENVQKILPFEDLKGNIIDLGLHQYRMIIKCNSINYNLKTEKEQDIIELSYQRFLNSLTHPISMFVQTKTMDNTKMLNSLREDMIKTVEDFPSLKEHAEMYFENMANVGNDIGNNKEKKKYIVVPYNDAILLTNASDEEKYDYALKELYSRCQIIIDGLQGVGISSSVLNAKEVLDLIYTSYHKDNASQIENIVNGEFLSMMVGGTDRLSKLVDEGRLDWIIYEAQLRLQTEISNDNSVSPKVKEKALRAISDFNNIRNQLAGHYKTNINLKIIKDDEK